MKLFGSLIALGFIFFLLDCYMCSIYVYKYGSIFRSLFNVDIFYLAIFFGVYATSDQIKENKDNF